MIGLLMISLVWSAVVYPCLTFYVSLGNAVVLTF